MPTVNRFLQTALKLADRRARVLLEWTLRITAACVLAASLASDALTATLNVPADHPTIRAAVAVAVDGDTILVAPGVHAGGAWINGKSVTIASWYIVTADTALVPQTVLDGVVANACDGAAGCTGNAVLEFGDSANGSAVIGLTITKGENGVASGSTVDIRHCRVIANGDGVDFVSGAGGTFRNNLFANNSDDGIDLNGRMDVAILDNDIRDNRDDGIEFRLYAYVGAARQVAIIGNRISGNGEDGVQLIDYPGAGNYIIRIERNLFQSNFDASGLSAAIACMPDAETIESLVGAPMTKRLSVINNTFIGEKNGLVGGANTIVLNNIFTGTEGTALRRVGGNSIASYSLFWNNGTDHVESTIDPAHDVHASPMLGATGTLLPASPAIDAGTAFFQWQGDTVLDLSTSEHAGSAPDLGAFETIANAAPLVSAGPDRTVILAADVVEIGPSDIFANPSRPPFVGTAMLGGTVSDDGVPYPPALSAVWSVVAGPGPVGFSDLRIASPQVTFSVPGTYFLRLSVDDGHLKSWDLVKVTVRAPINRIPIVNAGPPQTVNFPAAAMLEGTVVDDGLPYPPGAVAIAWSVGSGPGPVTFETPTLQATRATFTTIGTYVLRLSANDGELEAIDSVIVTVLRLRNRLPEVDAGADQTIMFPSDAILDGTVSDDGLPNPPATVSTTWNAVSGPGQVTFEDSSLVDTRAGFTVAGVYLLRLTANDGAASSSDTVVITVQPPPPPVEQRIASGSDDAEERDDGHIVRKTVGLDLGYDAGSQTVGLRFTSLAIPNGATILGAYIQFEAEAIQSEATNLILEGQAADNPLTFTYADHDVSSRPRTASVAYWSPPPWTVVGEAGTAQRTSDLRAVVQEIVDRPGWASGNAMVFIITGSGHRTARTQEAQPTGAALLHIVYSGLAPQMSAGPPGAAHGGGVESAAGEGTPFEPDASIGREAIALPSSRRGFAIVGLSPQPARGVLRVQFTLADDGPVTLELLDIAGRRVASREIAAQGAGGYTVELRERLPAGVYMVRLIQGSRTATKKAVVLQ